MLVYLSKKIAIPNQINLNCISWNQDQGWIACGGDIGLLKVLKLESVQESDSKLKGIAAPSNLSMNQSLEGHSGSIKCAAWNPQFRKLTTCDENGLIIVWMLHKGMWYEEMINNRNKSIVKDMKWSPDGRKICIVYEDGAVIVGSVDGNRLWGKELGFQLKLVEWSPDGSMILFVSLDTEIWVYDNTGVRIRPMSISEELVGDTAVLGISWHSNNNYYSNDMLYHPANLCLYFDNGMVLLSNGDSDVSPILLKTQLKITCCSWDNKGEIIAIGGTLIATKQKSEEKSELSKTVNIVQFYDNYGTYLRSVRIPGEKIASLTFEKTGLRMALAVDSFIFFANIRPNYNWGYFSNTLLYVYYRGSNKRDANIAFWDHRSGDLFVKQVSNFRYLSASSSCDLCAIGFIEKSVDESQQPQENKLLSVGKPTESTKDKPDKTSAEQFVVQLRNSIGSIVSSKKLIFTPKLISIGFNYFVAVDERTLYILNFQLMQSTSNMNGSTPNGADINPANVSSVNTGKGKERMIDIENISVAIPQPPETYKMIYDPIDNPIKCVCLSDKYLVVGRMNGTIIRFILPYLNPDHTFMVKSEPFRLELNCSSTKLSVIDVNGVLSIIDLVASIDVSLSEEKGQATDATYGKKLGVERRDVWDMKWAEDDDSMIAVMEKTKMIVINGKEMDVIDESAVSSGYIAAFSNLEIRVAILDELFSNPESPPSKDLLPILETKILRDVKDAVVISGLSGGYSMIDKVPHPRLWKLLAQLALEEMDWGIAERAFVKCGDYYGIQLVKQLRAMPDKMKARAEVALHSLKFDEAENIYREIDRKDLAVQMRKRIGDYPRVVQLLRTGGGGGITDDEIRHSLDEIGNTYADAFKWKKASQYFSESGNIDKLLECHYRLQNFEELSKLSSQLADSSPYLATVGVWFESVGMYEEAVDCFVRSGNPKSAVDCCVALNRWGSALELAEKYSFPQVEGLFHRLASSLISNPNPMKQLEAIELYRRANRPQEAAMLIADIAEKVARDAKPALAKKLHVLAALEVERHRKIATDNAIINSTLGTGAGGTVAQATAATLDTLMMTSLDTQSSGTSKRMLVAFGSAWRGATAYHFFMLAQNQFLQGKVDASMKTAIRCCEFDDILDGKQIYSLLCLISLRNNYFEICSKAFVKLETLPNLSDQERDEIETLSMKIFSTNSPNDPEKLLLPYIQCLESGKPYKACTLTGRAILESPSVMCRTCRNSMLQSEINKQSIKCCQICHSALLFD